MRATAVYSHGGNSSATGTTTGAGQAIDVTAAREHAAIFVAASGGDGEGNGTVTVTIEASGAPIDPLTGEPLETDWIDTLNGGIVLSVGDKICKKVMVEMPYWRTNILSMDPLMTVRSYIPLVRTGGETPVSATHISQTNNATEGM